MFVLPVLLGPSSAILCFIELGDLGDLGDADLMGWDCGIKNLYRQNLLSIYVNLWLFSNIVENENVI